MVLRGSFDWRAGGSGKNKEIVVETKVSLEAISLHSLQKASGELHTPSWQDESLTGSKKLKVIIELIN